MRSREPVKLNLTAWHNLVLVAWSSAMFLGTLVETVRTVWNSGAFGTFCALQPASGRLMYWFYHYYVSKYYELLDTVILCLKKVRCGGLGLH